jgi:hypothetical protein
MFEKGSYNFYPLASHCNPDLSVCGSKDSWFEPQFPGLCKYLITLTGAKVNVMRRHFKGRECQYGNVDCLRNTALREILKQGWWHDPQSRDIVLLPISIIHFFTSVTMGKDINEHIITYTRRYK